MINPKERQLNLKEMRTVFAVLSFFAMAGLVASVFFMGWHLSYKREVMDSTKAHLTSITSQASRSIDGIVKDVVDSVNSIAGQLSGGELTHETALKRLRELLEQHPHFFNICLSYAPYAFAPDRRLYSVLYVKKNGLTKCTQLDTIYDYTKPEHDWFGTALANGPHWSLPFYGKASQTFLITYSTPFYGKNRVTGKRYAKGVVTVSISMEEIRRIIETLDLGSSGFGALVSEKGIYLYHPNSDLVVARKSLAEAARELVDKDRLILSEKAAKRGSGVIDHRSKTTGLSAWLIYTPIPSTGWSLQNTFIKDDLPWDINLMRHQLIWFTISLEIFAVAVALLICQACIGSDTRLWAAALAVAFLFAAGIGSIWMISLSYEPFNGRDGIRITDKTTLHKVMNSFKRLSSERHTEAPVYIPTGIYLETASLNKSGDLSLSGYLWQKYRLGTVDSIPRGFTISGASSLESVESCRLRENGCEVVRWHFRCTVPQHIDHSKYPLELEKLSLQFLHKDLDHNVVLVPDLAAFKFINPTSLPGIRKGLILPGWELTSSFFELRKNIYDTNFGLERSILKENFPAFNFNVVIKRIFVDAFISNLTPLIIVVILLFTLLMITSRDERLVGFMQAGSGRIINICAAMFFIIAFNHIDIRRNIAAEQVFYLEYFYILIYLAILLVSINSVIFSVGMKLHLIQFRENLLFRLLFWPLLFGFLFVITAVTFY